MLGGKANQVLAQCSHRLKSKACVAAHLMPAASQERAIPMLARGPVIPAAVRGTSLLWRMRERTPSAPWLHHVARQRTSMSAAMASPILWPAVSEVTNKADLGW